LTYEINKENKNVKLFNSEFVKNNRNICKMIIDNKEYKLMEEFKIEGFKNK